MKTTRFTLLALAICSSSVSYAASDVPAIALPDLVVSADFRPNTAMATPVSMTTIDREIIESRGAQHIEDILNLAPNVNVSSGASRGQYYQIRGMGERSQFAAPINPSVGLIIDGIDLSRTGGAATLFDIAQVDILRGPQGTRYGTNALAGVISLHSTPPSDNTDIHVETGLAQYDTYQYGIAAGGALIENQLLGRFSVHHYLSDGYIHNDFLQKDNTQDKDELTARAHLQWLVDEDLTVDLHYLHLGIDNGYDAFNFNNSRHTLTDHPGEDKQVTNAFALKTDWRASDAVQLQSSFTYSRSNIVYSYDADWGYAGQFNPSLGPYIGFEQFLRDRENYSAELIALSNEQGRLFSDTTDWVIGLYYLDQREGLDQDSNYGIYGRTVLKNQYDTRNLALYGQLDTDLSEKLSLVTGLRVEYFNAHYSDSNALTIHTNDILFGGKVGLNYHVNQNQLLYTSLSRGYKSGGVNTDARLTPAQRHFSSEYVWDWETGLKSAWLDGSVVTDVNLFYMLRKNAQIKSSIQIGPEFIDLIDNAANGKNIGLEASLDWLVNQQFRLLASLGLLHTSFSHYHNARGFSLNGRRQAHAPNYQFSLGGEIYLTPRWTFRANIEGKDDFYFSNSHHAKSKPYTLLNASLDYAAGQWKISLWGRNLMNKRYATRGFFFGNDPSIGWADHKYIQLGDPRVIGLNLSWDY